MSSSDLNFMNEGHNFYKFKVVLSNLQHRDKNQIKIEFKFDPELKKLIKQINGTKWSQSKTCWYIENSPSNLKLLFKELKGIAWIDAEKLFNRKTSENPLDHNSNTIPAKKTKKTPLFDTTDIKLPNEYKELLLRRRYAESTIKTYTTLFKGFMAFFKDKEIIDLTENDIRQFQDYIVNVAKVSRSTQNQYINAIKFYYEHVLGNEKKNYYIERPRKVQVLPKVISEEEVMAIINAITNLKHKCIVALLYSSGLRMSELLNCRISDVSFEKSVIFVRGGKGKKDRITILSVETAKMLTQYLEEYKPNHWLFEGPNRKRYSASSVNEIIKKAYMKAGIRKHVTAHILRHSFATHLMEHGVDTMYIQNLMGHESPETTAIYAYVSNKSLAKIKSPFDEFFSSNKGINNKLE